METQENLFFFFLSFGLFLVVASALWFLGPSFSLFRVLFPSWRFFDQVAPSPVLLCRTGESSKSLGEWTPVLPKLKRKAQAFFLNSEGNYAHAARNLLEHLVNDLRALSSHSSGETRFQENVSYQLVKNLVEFQAPKQPFYQFKIVLRVARTGAEEDVILSPVYERDSHAQ